MHPAPRSAALVPAAAPPQLHAPQTYDNACFAGCAGTRAVGACRQRSRGACWLDCQAAKAGCKCDFQWAPACGHDGKVRGWTARGGPDSLPGRTVLQPFGCQTTTREHRGCCARATVWCTAGCNCDSSKEWHPSRAAAAMAGRPAEEQAGRQRTCRLACARSCRALAAAHWAACVRLTLAQPLSPPTLHAGLLQRLPH